MVFAIQSTGQSAAQNVGTYKDLHNFGQNVVKSAIDFYAAISVRLYFSPTNAFGNSKTDNKLFVLLSVMTI